MTIHIKRYILQKIFLNVSDQYHQLIIPLSKIKHILRQYRTNRLCLFQPYFNSRLNLEVRFIAIQLFIYHSSFEFINSQLFIQMGQSSDNSAQQDHGHSHQKHAKSLHPFTDHELYLIEMAKTHSKFERHHHHHHHQGHVQYRRPHKIDTSLGLFALKKLNAINPEFLLQKEKRFLQPVAPGVLTHLTYGSLMMVTAWYGFKSWKTLGYSFIMHPKTVIGLGALVGANYAVQIVFNYCREFLWSFDRQKLVDKYKQRYGQKFLLDVLQPTFRLPEASDSN